MPACARLALPTIFQRAAIATCSRKALYGVGNSLTGRWVIEYRAYFVGHDGHFVSFEGLSCADDAEAIAQAQRLVGNQDIELWSGERFIIRLRCKPDPSR